MIKIWAFIEKFKQVHGDKYDYSKCEGLRIRDYFTIICKNHGEFTQKGYKHLAGRGCSKCGDIKNNNKDSLYKPEKKFKGCFESFKKLKFSL